MKLKKILSYSLLVLLVFNPLKIVFADENPTESIEIDSSENYELETTEDDESSIYEESSESLSSEIFEGDNDESVEDILDMTEESSFTEENTTEEYLIMTDLIGLKLEDVYTQVNIPEDNIIVNYEIDDTIDEDIVLEQSIKEGEFYDENSLLELKVSSLPIEIKEDNENNIDLLSNFSLNEISTDESTLGNSNIFLNWDKVPYSYEYNWDNSGNCWYWGIWINGTCYKTPEGTYSTDVRHKMQIYCDGEYVYLHIIFSRYYDAKMNGDDFQFFINGEMAAFQVRDSDGRTLASQSYPVGKHSLIISHRNSSLSSKEAEGSEGYLVVNNDENINNQMEIKIPLTELKKQNSNINLDNVSMVEFFTPNLMYRKISCAGSSTFGIIILIPISVMILASIIIKGKKRN